MVSILSGSIFPLILFLSSVRSSPYLHECQSTSWYSEEQGYPSDKLDGYPMTELSCKGRHCDDLKARQCTVVDNKDKSLDLKAPVCEEMSWTFSEEHSGTGSCPEGMFVESMKCEGGFCDNIRLRCCKSPEWSPDSSQKINTPWFSPDYGEPCPLMHVVIGASCKDSYCGEMQLICAPIVANATAGKSYGSWAVVCSSNVQDNPCQFETTEMVSRDRKSTWSNQFTSRVNSSIAAGIIFGGVNVQLLEEVELSVGELVALGKDTEKSCSAEYPKPNLEAEESVWWQWIIDTEDISITDSDQTHDKLHMATCFFLMTSSFDDKPQCTPGTCMDPDCQYCENKDQ